MNKKEWRGLRAKRPVFVLLTPQETGEGAQGAGGLGPAALELGGGLRKGKKEPGGTGDRFPAAVRPGAVQGVLATEAVGQRRRRCSAGGPGPR